MIAPKFVRFNGEIFNIVFVTNISYIENQEQTYINFGQHGCISFAGDVRDELWGLIKLALEPKEVTQSDTAPEKSPVPERQVIGMFMNGSTVYNDSPRGVLIGPLSDGTLVYELN